MTELLGIVVVDCESTTGEKLYKVDIMDTMSYSHISTEIVLYPIGFAFLSVS